ncbi:MAG: hypothetical protein OJF62_001087 [Pseudolabrys sp.]|jgi:hypothetical protein|nr:hypothetical protein [Pseudolabrys sp.]
MSDTGDRPKKTSSPDMSPEAGLLLAEAIRHVGKKYHMPHYVAIADELESLSRVELKQTCDMKDPTEK